MKLHLIVAAVLIHATLMANSAFAYPCEDKIERSKTAAVNKAIAWENLSHDHSTQEEVTQNELRSAEAEEFQAEMAVRDCMDSLLGRP